MCKRQILYITAYSKLWAGGEEINKIFDAFYMLVHVSRYSEDVVF